MLIFLICVLADKIIMFHYFRPYVYKSMSNLFNIKSVPIYLHNTLSYKLRKFETHVITETATQIELPDDPDNTFAVLIMNISSNVTTVSTDDSSRLIYNHLYAPDGSTSIDMEPNRILYLIYVRNFSNTTGRWVSHLG